MLKQKKDNASIKRHSIRQICKILRTFLNNRNYETNIKKVACYARVVFYGCIVSFQRIVQQCMQVPASNIIEQNFSGEDPRVLRQMHECVCVCVYA